jgi:antitoxin (DNA-binding transcriptional repressor) of toxin-antitoxin stability system
MQVNLPEAQHQLSHLIKAAVAGEDVIISTIDHDRVRLVPFVHAAGLGQWGAWAGRFDGLDGAFSDEADAAVAQIFGCR